MGVFALLQETLVMQTAMATEQQSAIEWSEPDWSYRPRLKAELASVLDLKMWLRVVVVVIVLTAVFAYAVERGLPGLIEFNWVRGLILSFLVLAGMLGMNLGMMWFFRPAIRIDAKGISRTATSHHCRLRAEMARSLSTPRIRRIR